MLSPHWGLYYYTLSLHDALPILPKPRAAQQEKPPQWEAHALQWSSPRSLQLEKACVQQQRRNVAKNK